MATRVRLTPSVLVVNDALDEREMYARTLRASGYQAIEAATFTAAYQIATTNKLNIVVTDVRIAGSISGLELTRRLRNDARTSTVPIIVLTNVSRPQDGDIALEAGADTFLEKPVAVPVLKAEIARLLPVSRRLLSQPKLQRQSSDRLHRQADTLTVAGFAKLRGEIPLNHTDASDTLGRQPTRSRPRVATDGPCPRCGTAVEYRERLAHADGRTWSTSGRRSA